MQSIEASKKTEQAAFVRRAAAADYKTRLEKDLSSKHLQKIFNHLLIRSEKTKVPRLPIEKKVKQY